MPESSGARRAAVAGIPMGHKKADNHVVDLVNEAAAGGARQLCHGGSRSATSGGHGHLMDHAWNRATRPDSCCCCTQQKIFCESHTEKGSDKSRCFCRHQAMPWSRVASISRKAAMASLQEFRVMYRELKLVEEPRCRKQQDGVTPADDDVAFRVFRDRFCIEGYDDDRRYVGNVPGVKVGDMFHSDAELRFVGLHRSPHSCIGYSSKKGDSTCLAVSIVSPHVQHSHKDNSLDLLLHVVGQMGGTEGLALKQSMDTRTHVRVIHRFVADQQAGNSQSKELACYIYGGLYSVERKDHGTEDIFQLRRVVGQPRIDIKELVKKRMEQKPSNGIFIADISFGLETIPVSAINSISDEYPMAFVYILQRQRHPKYQLDPPSGCGCVGQCWDSQECACAVKNGGEIPFSDHGRILGEKPLVYECGPSCKCPPTCHNRVSQHGIKFRLQVFKTKPMGWGIRSLDFIPTGSFVCEYVGEVLDNKDAQERENDVYFFNTGDNYFNVPRWEGLVKTIPSLRSCPRKDESDIFVVDALKRGNVARFINHSCTPNHYSQNVLYDHDDISMPHIMFFAGDDIPPLQPLSFDYNYTLDEVHDAQGNIKKKPCFCGSSE